MTGILWWLGAVFAACFVAYGLWVRQSGRAARRRLEAELWSEVRSLYRAVADVNRDTARYVAAIDRHNAKRSPHFDRTDPWSNEP